LAALVNAAKARDLLAQNLVFGAARFIGTTTRRRRERVRPDRILIGGELSDASDLFLARSATPSGPLR
jgi:hypothetical protein